MLTTVEISWLRSPRRLKRFSVSPIDSRKVSMPRIVAPTAASAASVAVEACSAASLLLFESAAICASW